MKVISFINEKPVIRKILEHMNLWDVQQKQQRALHLWYLLFLAEIVVYDRLPSGGF